MDLPDFHEEEKLWKQGYELVIGVDEVGRGCFAGPVVASACAFAPNNHDSLFIIHNSDVRIDDSKRLKPNDRKKSAKWIREKCLAYGIGEVGVATINKVGIGKATAIAMRKAIATIISNIEALNTKQIQNANTKNSKHFEFRISNFEFTSPFLLIDAFYIPYIKGIPKIRQKAIKKGDQKSISIAAASIIAKVYRDNLMRRLAKKHPSYQWGRNKGYGTKFHQEAIKKNGITKLHRTAFIETFFSHSAILQ